MQDDIMKFVKHFEEYDCLFRGSNSSFTTLIPETKDPLSLIEFRPIRLIGCVYKIIAKSLASRLKRVIGSVTVRLSRISLKAKTFWMTQ